MSYGGVGACQLYYQTGEVLRSKKWNTYGMIDMKGVFDSKEAYGKTCKTLSLRGKKQIENGSKCNISVSFSVDRRIAPPLLFYLIFTFFLLALYIVKIVSKLPALVLVWNIIQRKSETRRKCI